MTCAPGKERSPEISASRAQPLREVEGRPGAWGRAVSGRRASRLAGQACQPGEGTLAGRCWRAGPLAGAGNASCGVARVRGRGGATVLGWPSGGRRCAMGHGSGRWAEEKGGERSGPPGFAGPRGEGKRRWRAGPLRVLGWMLGLVFLSISLFLILIQTQAKRIQINLNSNSNQTTKEKMLQHECNNKV